MEELKTIRPAAYDWMMKLPLELWALHKFNPAVKVVHVTNNFTESFNSWVSDLRTKPIVTLLDGLRSKMMARIRSRFDQAATWDGGVTKTAKTKLEKISQESRKCSVLFAGGDEYEVLDRQRRYVVILGRKTCSCGAWEISGIPCRHGTACALYRRMRLEDLVDPYFSKTKYMETYERIIHPMLDESMWDGEVIGDPIEPPKLRRLPGRPRKNRRREEDEPTAGTSDQRKWHSIKCKTCGQIGHNKRTCQRAPVKKRKSASRTSNSMPTKLQPVRRRPAAATTQTLPPQPATPPSQTATPPPQPSQSSAI